MCGPCVAVEVDDDHPKSDGSGSTAASDTDISEQVVSARIIQIWWKKRLKLRLNKLVTNPT